MAYYDSLIPMDPSFYDSCLLDNFSKQTDTIATLQKSFDFQNFDQNNIDFLSEMVSPWLNNSDTTTASGGSVGKYSSSLMDTKKRRSMVSGDGGGDGGEKIRKRRSRATKRAKVTYINADVDNFRQLVQEFTSDKFGGGGDGGGGGVVKPEPQRAVRLQMIGGASGLPTLDTSAFGVGPTHQNEQLHKVGGGGVLPSAADVVVAEGGSASSSSKFDFSFPTLESWEAI